MSVTTIAKLHDYGLLGKKKNHTDIGPILLRLKVILWFLNNIVYFDNLLHYNAQTQQAGTLHTFVEGLKIFFNYLKVFKTAALILNYSKSRKFTKHLQEY